MKLGFPLSPGRSRVPAAIQQAFLIGTAESSLSIGRRLALLGVLWNESYLRQPALVARVEALLGAGCFGKRRSLTFARDVQFIREILKAEGYRLGYSRRQKRAGYYIAGRPPLDLALVKRIEAAVSEVSPEQISVYSRLTPAQRVRQGASLSDRLRRQAARRLKEENPQLGEAEANREALRRMYRLER